MPGSTADLVVRVQANIGQATSALTQLQAQMTELGRTVGAPGGAGGNFVGVEEGAHQATRAVKESEEGVRTFHESLLDIGKEAVAFTAGMVGIQVAQGVFENLKTAIIDFPEMLEKTRISFEAFLGSGSAAGSLLGQIVGLGNVTPFHTEALAQTGQLLVGLGVPAEQVAIQIRDIAAATAAVGRGDSGLQATALALARIQEMGVLDSRIMRQLTTEGLPAWNILADAMDKPVVALQKLVAHGQISSDMFLAAFHEWASTTAGDVLAKQVDTLSGSLTVFQNRTQVLLSEALAPLTENLTRAANAAARMSESHDAQDWADNVAASLIRVNALGAQLPPTVQAAASVMGQLATPTSTVAFSVGLLATQWNIALANMENSTDAHIAAIGKTLAGLSAAVGGIGTDITVTGTKDAAITPGLAAGKDTGAVAFLKATEGSTFAVRRTRDEFEGMRADEQSAAQGASSITSALDEIALAAKRAKEEAAGGVAPAGIANFGFLWQPDDSRAVNEQLVTARDNLGALQEAARSATTAIRPFSAEIDATDKAIARIELAQLEKQYDRLSKHPARTPGQQIHVLTLHREILQHEQTIATPFGATASAAKDPKVLAAEDYIKKLERQAHQLDEQKKQVQDIANLYKGFAPDFSGRAPFETAPPVPSPSGAPGVGGNTAGAAPWETSGIPSIANATISAPTTNTVTVNLGGVVVHNDVDVGKVADQAANAVLDVLIKSGQGSSNSASEQLAGVRKSN